ncbi:MAG: dTMP kinase [Pseudomonadota bacterium]
MAPFKDGFFISFEGGDGAGKTTQIHRLSKRLEAAGRKVVLTREPGGSTGAEMIRSLLVEGPVDRWSPLTEALLMAAARRDHLERTILPALQTGAVVITDRFADSTMAYQGIAGEAGRENVAALTDLTVGKHRPDLTLILDIDVDEGLRRASGRGGEETRFESKGSEFQRQVRAAFQEIAHNDPARCVIIKADASVDEIAEAVWRAVAAKAPGLVGGG